MRASRWRSPADLAAHAEGAGARAAAVSARIEAELSELDDEEEAAAMREELGARRVRPPTVIREAWELLGLITFFTAGEGKEGRAWAIEQGTRRGGPPASIHTDIERGFVAAEVVHWQDLVEAGGYAAAREQAKLRIEGRDYEVQGRGRDHRPLHAMSRPQPAPGVGRRPGRRRAGVVLGRLAASPARRGQQGLRAGRRGVGQAIPRSCAPPKR